MTFHVPYEITSYTVRWALDRIGIGMDSRRVPSNYVHTVIHICTCTCIMYRDGGAVMVYV